MPLSAICPRRGASILKEVDRMASILTQFEPTRDSAKPVKRNTRVTVDIGAFEYNAPAK